MVVAAAAASSVTADSAAPTATATTTTTADPRFQQADEADGGDQAASSSADPQQLRVVVRPAAGQLELRQVARLRAEAYHADERSRFAESFKKQFAAQEAESLQHRTAPRNGRAPQCDCLVAVEPSEGGGGGGTGGTGGLVVGCIDIRVPMSATGVPPSGVPQGETRGAYLVNVVVDARARGRGVGRALMRAAMARAVEVWGATRLFTEVEAGNDVASALYRGCGFSDYGESSGAHQGASTLGRLILLVAEAGDDPAAAGGGAGGAGSASGGNGDGAATAA